MPSGSGSNFIIILTQVAVQLPVMAVLVAGLVISIINRKNYPKACTFAIIGFSLMIFERLVSASLNILLPTILLQGSSATYSQYSIILGVVNITFTLLDAGALGLLLAAIFAGRKPEPKPADPYAGYYNQPPR